MKERNLANLQWRDHREALWWLGLLYRRPDVLRENIASLPTISTKLIVGLKLYIHIWPYVVLVAFLVRWAIVGYFDLPFDLRGFINGIIIGFVFGLAVGGIPESVTGLGIAICGGIIGGAMLGIGVGVTEGVTEYIPSEIQYEFIKGLGLGAILSILLGTLMATVKIVTFDLFLGIMWGIITAFFLGISSGLAFGIGAGIAGSAIILRLYYLPFNAILLAMPNKGKAYPWHPVAWDNQCALPFWRLEKLLVAFAERNEDLGLREIDRLIDTYPAQRSAALRAKTIIVAREAGSAENLTVLDDVLSSLPEGEKGYLKQTRDIRILAHEITLQQTRLDTQPRPYVRREMALALVGLIESFSSRIAGFKEPLVTEFRRAAGEWKKKAETQLHEAEEVLHKDPVVQVFQAGRPVDPAREAFVPRLAVLEKLAQQAAMAAGSPGVVLYGRRRTGKSTTLQNLRLFLPGTVTPVVFSMQNPHQFTSLDSFIKSLAQGVSEAHPLVTKPLLESSGLTGFFNFLGDYSNQLESEGERLMICIDEYEGIDTQILGQVFPIELLHTFRESIQKHRGLIWVFAGSHRITELKADWTSYLVSARTVNVPAFSMEETRLLLTQPFSQMKSIERQVTFEPGFWGEDGIERIFDETQGWPHLVQLVAQTSIDLLNDSNEQQMTVALLEEAFERSVEEAETTLSQLLRGESRLTGEWEYLQQFQRTASQPPPDDLAVASSLRNRELVTIEENEWRIRVPLFQRWLTRQ